MHADFQAQLAFHLTGQALADGPQPAAPFELVPALLARYRDLSALRYDFPLVFADNGEIFSLSDLVNQVVDKTNTKTYRDALRREREIRASLASGVHAQLPEAWGKGELADCDARLPGRMLAHVWGAQQAQRAAAMREKIAALSARLAEILAADAARSDESRSAEKLHASFGGHDAGIDFNALSGLLKRALPARALADSRQRRIARLIEELRAQPFGPFVFGNCAEALAAYRARLPQLVTLSKAIAAARLEAAGEYAEERHDLFFQTCGAALLAAEGLADFPGTLVRLEGSALEYPANTDLAELLAAGLPFKVLVQFGDILQKRPVGRPGFGLRAQALAGMALSVPDLYVLQCPASALYELRSAVRRGLESGGAALFSVLCGTAGEFGSLPPYLVAAAALESRAFPVLRYDPAAPAEERFSLEGNPQPDADWAERAFEYEDAEHQRVREELAFTLADFAACDARHASGFARVPRERCNGSMVPLRESLVAPITGAPDKVPYALTVGEDGRVWKTIVAEELAGEARRSLEYWRSLRAKVVRKPEPAPVVEEKVVPAKTETPAPVVEAEKPKADDPYIETPRCTTCEECIKINPRLFVYDENKQAHIADLAAGSYRELVEAAESCQVSIIHPGKPRDPNEPGLAELLERAQPFL